MRDFGVAISLDDFGTGYSSFTYLAQIPITTLKNDKSMVDKITDFGNSKSPLLMESLLQLSSLLGFRVLAAGVPLAVVSAWLGHTQRSTTLNIYTHPSEKGFSMGAETINEVLKPSSKNVEKVIEQNDSIKTLIPDCLN